MTQPKTGVQKQPWAGSDRVQPRLDITADPRCVRWYSHEVAAPMGKRPALMRYHMHCHDAEGRAEALCNANAAGTCLPTCSCNSLVRVQCVLQRIICLLLSCARDGRELHLAELGEGQKRASEDRCNASCRLWTMTTTPCTRNSTSLRELSRACVHGGK